MSQEKKPDVAPELQAVENAGGPVIHDSVKDEVVAHPLLDIANLRTYFHTDDGSSRGRCCGFGR